MGPFSSLLTEEIYPIFRIHTCVIVQALVSFRKCDKVLNSHLLVAQLSSFFPYCGLSYLGLITGTDVDRMTGIAVGGMFLSAAIFTAIKSAIYLCS